MEFIKSYKVFESDVDSHMISDIKDILIELEDDGIIGTIINNTKGKNRKYVGFYKKVDTDEGIYFEEISDYVFRLKDYIGDKFRLCSVIFKDPNLNRKNNGRVNIDLDDESQIKDLKKTPIRNLIIDIK